MTNFSFSPLSTSVRTIFWVFLTLIGFSASAQSIVVGGQVLYNQLPASGVPITVTINNGSAATTFTDSMGNYSVTMTRPLITQGTIVVTAGCPSGTPVTGTAPFNPASSQYTINIVCGSGGSRFAYVSGTVSDAAGLPMSGVPVQVILGSGTALTDITDTSGYYWVSGAFPSSTVSNLITVTAVCTQAPVTATTTYTPNVPQYVVNLTCGGGGPFQILAVTGTLIGPAGTGLAGQTVQFQNLTNGTIAGSTITTAGGLFADTLTLPINAIGMGMLIASAPCGNGTVTRDTVTFSQTATAVNFLLNCSNSGGGGRQATVSGIVSSNLGVPLSGIQVQVLLGSGAPLTDVTDSSGYYSVTGTFAIISPILSIVVTANCPSGPIVGNATYTPNITNYTVNLTCGTGGGGGTPRLYNLQGTLTDVSGNGLSGVQVRIFRPGQTLPLRTLTTGAGGFFSDTLSLTPSSTLTYLVASASCGNGTAARDTATLLPTTQTIIFQMSCGGSSSASLSGLVMGYLPRAGGLQDTLEVIVIQVTQQGTPQAIWTPIDTLVVVDSAGYAPFQTTVTPGTYSVLAILRTGNAANYLPTYFGDTTTWSQASTLTLSNTGSFMVIDLMEALSPGTGTGGVGGGVGGTLPRLANPLTGVWVQLLNSQQTLVHRSVATNAQGVYSFNNLPFGTYYIRCEYPGEHSDRIRVDLTGSNPTQVNHSFTSGPGGFSTATGVTNPSQLPRIHVFPNPVLNGRLWVRCASEHCAAQWLIRDLSGRQVLASSGVAGTETDSSVELDVTRLTPGLYTLEWISPRGMHVGRFMVR
jgi:phosphatidate phosphatase APP1